MPPSPRAAQAELSALAVQTFEEACTPTVVGAAVRQAQREATPHLNTTDSGARRYGRLTALEPTTAPLATESRARRERQATWHARRALEPQLHELFTSERECELIDTRADAPPSGLL